MSTALRELYLKDLHTQIKKTCQINIPKAVNKDMLWKQNVVLKFIDDNNIVPKNVLDVGAGCAALSLYLIKFMDVKYTGVDFFKDEDPNNPLIEFKQSLQHNKIVSEKISYLNQDFLTFNPAEKFDVIYDICAITHFNPSKNITANDGIYHTGQIIEKSLTDDGVFFCSSDCFDANKRNHRGEFNTEYVTVEQIVESFEKASLVLNTKFSPVYLSAEAINRSYDFDLETVLKGWGHFDRGHMDHYDRVCLAFSKK